jgi:effector-binding domain-containing protein
MHQEPHVRQRDAQVYAGIPVTVTMASMASAIDAGFPELFGWLAEQGVQPAQAPFIRYHAIDMDAELEIELGIPLPAPLPGSGRVQPGVLPAGRYVTMMHTGPYDGLVASNAALQDWARQQGIPLEGSPDGPFRGRVEHYLTNPAAEPDPAKWEVEVAYLVDDGAASGG